VEFSSLPASPSDARYTYRLRDIERLLKAKPERLVEEGMLMDRATADDDFYWFCRRFTSFQNYKITEQGHPLRGQLWIDHPYSFAMCRIYQETLVEPLDGWVWIKVHRYGLKTTLALALCLWIHSIDDTAGGFHRNLGLSRTIGLWTHNQGKIGTGMGRGALAQLQTERLRDHYPQFRNLREGTTQGYVVDRPAGPREQSLFIQSILAAAESKHPDIYLLDDVVTAQLRGNVEQIARISNNISDIAALMTPDCPVIVFNTPKDKADPLIQRERDGLFARVITQAAMLGGDFTPAGEANLHTERYFARRRREIRNDQIYFAEFELEFKETAETLLSWDWIPLYEQTPEELARAHPYVNIVVDGAGGGARSDFTVIRVATWIGNDTWANLDLIRERMGASKTMQLLLGRDPQDASSGWIDSFYGHNGVGLVERWMRIDPQLIIWFDDHGNAGWIDTFQEMMRLRRVRFSGGREPTIRKWPQIHRNHQAAVTKSDGTRSSGSGSNKLWKIRALETPYQRGLIRYPRAGFGHGTYNGLGGAQDLRDTMVQFREDEFERLALGQKLPFDDMLDTEALLNMSQAQIQMRRPSKAAGGVTAGGIEYPPATVDNPFGVPLGAMLGQQKRGERSWLSW